MKNQSLSEVFINKGDIDDISQSTAELYFSGNMLPVSAYTSCAYKHLLVYEALLESGDDYALVIEDDIYFYNNFSVILPKILEEITSHKHKNFIISLEDSILKYVSGKVRKQNKYLYPAIKGRLAGTYLIDRQAAQRILDIVKEDKMNIPIDMFHDKCSESGVINMLWSHPTLTCQGSTSGRIMTLIDQKEYSLRKRISFQLRKYFRRFLYRYFR